MLFDAKCAYNEAPLDDEHILFSVETLYRVGVCRGLEVKAKKLTKASAMAKKSSHDWNKPNDKKQRKGRWVIIHEKQRKEKEGNGIGLKQKNEKRDF